MTITTWAKILNTSGLSPNAVRAAYLRSALESHPDRGGSHERMILINTAWEAAEKYLAKKEKKI